MVKTHHIPETMLLMFAHLSSITGIKDTKLLETAIGIGLLKLLEAIDEGNEQKADNSTTDTMPVR